MKRYIALLVIILTILGTCACSLDEISKTSPVGAADIVEEPTQSSNVIETDKTVVLDISEQNMSEPSAASEAAVSDGTSDTLPPDIVGKQEVSTSQATTEPPQTTPKETESQTEQKTPAQSEETTPKAEQPSETSKPQEPEPSASSGSEKPSTPKTAYDYEFDIHQIRNDLIALAKGYGLTLDESLNPNNASWANPVFATKNTQGDLLKRLLNESIQYYADKGFRASMGLPDLGLTIFNIYCESLGNGVYKIYFLNY